MFANALDVDKETLSLKELFSKNLTENDFQDFVEQVSYNLSTNEKSFCIKALNCLIEFKEEFNTSFEYDKLRLGSFYCSYILIKLSKDELNESQLKEIIGFYDKEFPECKFEGLVRIASGVVFQSIEEFKQIHFSIFKLPPKQLIKNLSFSLFSFAFHLDHQENIYDQDDDFFIFPELFKQAINIIKAVDTKQQNITIKDNDINLTKIKDQDIFILKLSTVRIFDFIIKFLDNKAPNVNITFYNLNQNELEDIFNIFLSESELIFDIYSKNKEEIKKNNHLLLNYNWNFFTREVGRLLKTAKCLNTNILNIFFQHNDC